MLESYVRSAPKKHELYERNIEVRRYACREHGGTCGEWLIGEALRTAERAAPSDGQSAESRALEARDVPQGRRTRQPTLAVTSADLHEECRGL